MNTPTPTPPLPEPAFRVVRSSTLQSLQDAGRELAETRDQMLRLRADFDNFRKRLQKDKDDAVRFANESLIGDLLPILDNFELGLKAAASAADAQGILQGMTMVKSQLERLLTDYGVQPIDALHQPFDPHLHEAVGQQPSADHPEGTVLAQHRRGYRLHDRLLRPATVVVAQAAPTSTPA